MWEAVVWCLAGFICLMYSRLKLYGRNRKLPAIAGINFLVFGLTDLYEMRTGAWWSPVWLLVIKVSCISVFIALYLIYRKKHA